MDCFGIHYRRHWFLVLLSRADLINGVFVSPRIFPMCYALLSLFRSMYSGARTGGYETDGAPLLRSNDGLGRNKANSMRCPKLQFDIVIVCIDSENSSSFTDASKAPIGETSRASCRYAGFRTCPATLSSKVFSNRKRRCPQQSIESPILPQSRPRSGCIVAWHGRTARPPGDQRQQQPSRCQFAHQYGQDLLLSGRCRLESAGSTP